MKTVCEIMDMIEAWHVVENADPDQHGLLADIEREIRALTKNTAPAAEVVREPATDEQVLIGFRRDSYEDFATYCGGWRDAERFYGIKEAK